MAVFRRERVRTAVSVLGAVAVFLAVMPYSRYEMGGPTTPAQREHLRASPDDTPSSEEYAFGWLGSPLVRYHNQTALVERPDGAITVKKSGGLNVGWVSWSSLTLAVGVGLMWAARRLRRPAGPPPSA